MDREEKIKSNELTYGDFLSLDKKLFPLLGEAELSGSHLRLLFVMTHSSLTKGNNYPKAYKTNEYKAFHYLIDHKDDAFGTDFILGLHRALVSENGGTWKNKNTYFEKPNGGFYITTSAEKTPEVMERLCRDFSFLNSPKEAEFEEIFKFILHFICIHPFLDGNGRISSFLLQFLLYKAGLSAALYLPLDTLIYGLNGPRTSLEIQRASGSFYGMRPLLFDRYIPYMKDILHKGYLYLIEALEQ